MQDKLGQEITEGSFVAAPRGPRELAVCRVIKISEKMIRVVRIDKPEVVFLAWPSEVVLISSIDVLALKLK